MGFHRVEAFRFFVVSGTFAVGCARIISIDDETVQRDSKYNERQAGFRFRVTKGTAVEWALFCKPVSVVMESGDTDR